MLNSPSLPSFNSLKHYNLNLKHAGLAVMIINYEQNDPQNNRCDDYDPELDISGFNTLECFNFQTLVYRNQTRDQIEGLINECVNFDYSQYGCCFLSISSIGDKTSIISSDHQKIQLDEEIIEKLCHSESLKNKPKIFLFDLFMGNSGTKSAIEMKYANTHDIFIGFYSALERFKTERLIRTFFHVLGGNQDENMITWNHLIKSTVAKMSEINPPIFSHDENCVLTFVKKSNNLLEQHKLANKRLRKRLKKALVAKEHFKIENDKLKDQLMNERVKRGDLNVEIEILKDKLTKYERNTTCYKTLTADYNVWRLVSLRDGCTLVSGGHGGNITIWNVQTGEIVRHLKGHTSIIVSLKVLSDGHLASGSLDNTIKIWNPQSGHLLRTLVGHKDWVSSLEELNEWLVSGSEDRTVKIWDWQMSGDLLITLEMPDEICQLVSLRECNLVVRFVNLPQLVIVNGKSLKEVGRIEDKTKISTMTVLGDGMSLVTYSAAGKLSVWNGLSGKLVGNLVEGHKEGICCLSSRVDGTLVSGSWDGEIQIWHGQVLLRSFKSHDNYISSMTNVRDYGGGEGDLLLVSCSNLSKEIKIWK